MRIERLEFWNKDTGWHLAPTEFFPDLTLLVGVSGAGKTRILSVIEALAEFAKGQLPRELVGAEWDIGFSTAQGEYGWRGQLTGGESPDFPNGILREDLEGLLHDDLAPGQVIRVYEPMKLHETLTVNNSRVVERESEHIRLNGKELPKLSPLESVINLLRLEDAIRPAFEAFRRIVFHEAIVSNKLPLVINVADWASGYPTVDEIRESHLPINFRLALAHENALEVFSQITERFRDVFPQVEDIRFDQVLWHNKRGHTWVLQIKEKGLSKWIPETNISAGMLRTLLHFASVELWPKGSVILSDEIENSLGVNCLDAVTQSMVDERRHLQFIVTSHHPYIINNIPPKHWKVVTRNGSVVSTHNADELGIGKSHHDAFIQLMNSEQYQEGIAAG